METEFLKMVYEDIKAATAELIKAAGAGQGDILVVGCSSSEVNGDVIGTASSVDTAKVIFDGIYEVADGHGIYVAAQCCEHLNRALIIEKELADIKDLEVVCVVPQPKAGGSFATAAYKSFKHPVAVEHIKADLGMDIGDTLIGMHLRDVAVPVRLSFKGVGSANLVCAKTRPKYIGGERARYN